MRRGGASATATWARAQMRSYSTSRRPAVSRFEFVEPAWHIVGIENDGGGDDRPGQRPAPSLIAACHRPDAALERGTLAPERRPEDFFIERQACDSGSIATHAAMMTTRRTDCNVERSSTKIAGTAALDQRLNSA